MKALTNYAPVVLFVYNRPLHTKKTVDALKLNKGAAQTDLIVYSDGAKYQNDESMVEKTREFLDQISGFRSVTIKKRLENWGLAASIIDGVTTVVEKYGRVIVLEDDIVTSPAFLCFMNQGLSFYEYNKKVWHISGWNYPVDFNGIGDAYLWRGMNCWGWATWADRWKFFEKDPGKLIRTWNSERKYRFDLDGSGVFWSQVEANYREKINTWAIFWYATIFQNDGLCVNPSLSYVNNIGHDGTGQNCGYDTSHGIVEVNLSPDLSLPVECNESYLAVAKIKEFYKSQKKSLATRVVNRVYRKMRGRNIL